MVIYKLFCPKDSGYSCTNQTHLMLDFVNMVTTCARTKVSKPSIILEYLDESTFSG